MLLKNKKGVGLGLYLAAGIILALFIFFINYASDMEIEQTLGDNQQTILLSYQNADAISAYLKQAAKFSTQKVARDFSFDLFDQESSCGEHIHKIYSNEQGSCTPDFEKSFKDFTKDKFTDYLAKYPFIPLLSFDYGISLDQTYENQQTRENPELSVKFYSESGNPIIVPIGTFKTNSEMVYPVGPTGGCGDEKIVNCTTNDCFANIAQTLFNTYEYAGIKYEYIWGGESPYTYTDTAKGGMCSEFFDKVSVSAYEPEKSIRTQPGFDCSGWVWWTAKHAGVDLGDVRKTANDYYLDFLKDYESDKNKSLIWEKTTQDLDLITSIIFLKPGDILFSKKDGQNDITHIMIYVGDNKIIHSRSGSGGGLVTEDISNDKLSQIQLIARYLPLDISIEESTITTTEEGSACILDFDETAWTQKDIRTNMQDIDFEKLNQKLLTYENNLFLDSLQRADEDNLKIPIQLVKAIMYAEVGGQHFDNYISGQTKCSDIGYCGLLQMGKSACDMVGVCEWDILSIGKTSTINDIDRDYRELGIEAGAAYLSVIYKELIRRGYMTDVEPNYYFVALAYNSGTQGAINIIDAAMKRTGKTKKQIRWSDIIKEDIKAQWSKTTKIDEVFGYPNLVGKALQAQCAGNPYMTYSTGFPKSNSYIVLKPLIETKANFDINKYDVVDDFIDYLETECTLRSQNECIKTAINKFSSEDIEITHLSDYTYYYDQTDIFDAASNIYDFFSDDESLTETDIYERLLPSKTMYRDAFRDMIIDQIIDCQKNNQENCVCPIYVNYKYLDVGSLFNFFKNPDDVYIMEDDSVYHMKGVEILPSERTVPLELNFNLAKFLQNEEIQEFTKLNFDFTKLENTNEVEITFSKRATDKTYTTSTYQGEASNFAFYKTSKKDLAWYNYEDKETEPPLCMNNKHYQRFSIKFFNTTDVKFSAFIDDRVPPNADKIKTDLKFNSQANCINTNTALLSWALYGVDEPVYAFKLYLGNPTFSEEATQSIHLDSAIHLTEAEIKSSFPIKLNQLYYDGEQGKYFYYVNSINEEEFELETAYSFGVMPVDHFGNSNNFEHTRFISKTFTLKDELSGNGDYLTLLSQTTGVDLQSVSAICDFMDEGSAIDLSANPLISQFENSLSGDLISQLGNLGIGCCIHRTKEVIFNEPIFQS